ncbi:hypothetical protein [Piscirickettsia salmonis]|uniref:hypothetical protein n=1 Tax=Piscirickettsia salmonis TaxID=1238 RepID=UPI00094A904A|nr:hypothetical protein [Piscirickettsia salmonis]APS75195.1 hypothetical protein AVM70_16610 [Piscirickettsia salmonis]APS78433.1 hypothetical protein AVM74_16630 [Piscirickettsia salmonis]
MLKIRQPKERVTVVYPWMTVICKNNPCASAILALSTFRHNEYGWSEHYLSREDLKEALFHQFTLYQIGKALKQLFANKIFTQIKRKCYDRTTVFSLNTQAISAFLEGYKTQYPIKERQKTKEYKSAGSLETPQVANSKNGGVEIDFSIKEVQKDKESINNPVLNFEQCASQGDIVIELEFVLTQLREEKRKHNDRLLENIDLDDWAKKEKELRSALLETQEALDEAKAMNSEITLNKSCNTEGVTPNLSNDLSNDLAVLEDVPVDMAVAHGAVTNQLSQNFYKQQKTSAGREVTNKHMQRLKHFSKKFGNSLDEMLWFLKNAYTEKGYTIDKVMGILSAIAPTFTRPNGMASF